MNKGNAEEEAFVGLVTDINFVIKAAIHCARTRKMIERRSRAVLNKEEMTKLGNLVIIR